MMQPKLYSDNLVDLRDCIVFKKMALEHSTKFWNFKKCSVFGENNNSIQILRK